jgi:GalNAc5-diNAcBac-PP-undecaprenol beta-1,3-glucosyltransferase
MNAPFFTIIVPSYNRAAFLQRTITSIIQQNYKDLEVIIVDDGSTDNTKGCIIDLQKKYSQLKYVFQQNSERGAARNNGIRHAQGQYILFFDSDDEMKDGYLEELYKGISDHPNYNFFAAKYNFIQNGKEYASMIDGFKAGPYGVETVLKGNPFACNFCIKKGHSALKLFVEDRTLATTEDWIFLVENLFKEKIYLIDFLGLSMHQHDGRSMQQNQTLIERRLQATELLCKKLDFSREQKNIIWGYTYYFCSIHAYLDRRNKQSVFFIKNAIALQGLKFEFIKAYIKYIIGRKTILKLGSILRAPLDRS